METITITLNEKEVSGQSGMTILDLARESDVVIPTLCHDPNLTPSGACRICIVEDERSGALLASCVTPIAPGMIINTRSPRVQDRRETLIKLMLASHPDTCVVCDKGNQCQLRKIASDMGIGYIEFYRIPQLANIQEVNPFIERDLSKCILCAKCIRADQELVVEGAIDYFHRGFTSKPATLNDLALETSECTFCGTCVAMCPTGALTETEKCYRGATSTTIHTICPFCGCGCGIYLDVKDNQIVRSKPDEESPINRGTLCVKGSYGYDFVHSPDRLTNPLININGEFKVASWEQALNLVAAQFNRIKETHGPNSLAVLGSSKCTNEDNYILQRFARSVLGTNNIDNGSRLYGSAAQIILGSLTGYPGTTKYLNDLEQADVILVIGADPTSSNPVVGYTIKRAVKYKGAQLILIDPRQTKLSSFTHLWLKPKVNTDVALLNSMAKVIIDEGLLDEEFISRRTDNFKDLTKVLKNYSSEYAETITGVPGEKIREAARSYAQANQAAIIYSTGITQNTNGTDTIKAVANLMILTGNIGRKGGGIYALQRENNAQGACDMGSLPDFLPGYCSVVDKEERGKFEESWGLQLPTNPGASAIEIVDYIKEGKINCLFIVGENPVRSFPNQDLVIEALNSLDFLVVQDIFLSETAKLATVVLPASSFVEKDGTFTNFEGRLQKITKIIDPVGESMPDWEIILRIADKMNYPMPFSSLNEIMDEMGKLVPTYESHIGSREYYQDEMDAIESRQVYGDHFLKGFVRFAPVEYTIQEELAKEDYPFKLVTGTALFQFGTGSRSARASRLSKFVPEAFVEIHELDARNLGINNGDRVKIISPVSEITATAKVTNTLSQGMLFIPMSFLDGSANKLFDIILDPQTKTPASKTCSVNLERL